MADEPRPYTLVAELTYRCPLRCVYCSNPLDWARHGDALETEDWLRIFREAEDLGVVQLNLTGGEPLLRADLESLVEGARALDLYTNLITSGIPLPRERLAEGAGAAAHAEHRPAPRQSRSGRRHRRAGGIARCRPAGAGQHAVPGLGTAEPGGAVADARAARACARDRPGGAPAPAGTDGGPLRHARLLRGLPEGLHGRLGTPFHRRRPRRPRAPLPRRPHAARTRLRQRPGPTAGRHLAVVLRVRRVPR